MADRTGIEWTDATWNPVRGCSRVSEGCKHCYAERVAARFHGPGQPYEGLIHPSTGGWNGKVKLVPEALDQPLRWRRPRRIFVNSMSDLFHEAVPEPFIDQVFAVMALATQHQFQVLTKRPARMLEYLTTDGGNDHREDTAYSRIRALQFRRGIGSRPGEVNVGNDVSQRRWPLPNVWLGVSVEDQAAADERIPLLLQCPAAVRWISAEPLLGPVDLDHLRGNPGPPALPEHNVFTAIHPTAPWKLDWVVAGGESGPGARPMHPDWARSLRDQCAAGGVPFLFKHWGAWAPSGQFVPYPVNDGTTVRVQTFPDLTCALCIGKKAAGRHLDGVLHDGYPVVRHG